MPALSECEYTTSVGEIIPWAVATVAQSSVSQKTGEN